MGVKALKTVLISIAVGLGGASYADNGEDIEVVLTVSGSLGEGWRLDTVCLPTGKCADAIVDEAGEFAVFDGVVSVGFIETGNGQEVVRQLQSEDDFSGFSLDVSGDIQ